MCKARKIRPFDHYGSMTLNVIRKNNEQRKLSVGNL